MLKDVHTKPKGFFKWFNNMFDKATQKYSVLVQKTIRYSILSILLFGGLIFVSYDMLKDLKTGLVPQEDQGTIFLFSYNPPGASLSRTEKLTKEINQIVMDNENVEEVVSLAGLDLVTFGQRTHAAATIIKLNDWEERPNAMQHATVINEKFNKQLMATSDGFTFGVLPPPIMGMSISGGFEMYVQDRSGGKIENLSKYVNEIVSKANKREELQGVRTSLNPNIPQYRILVDIKKSKKQKV